MNPDLPHNLREELEARLSALLLGELSAEDAELLRKLIAHDPELTRLHDQLKLTIELVRETASDPIEQASPQAAPLKMSAKKREKLLARFKTVTPKEFVPPRRSKFSLFRVAAAVAVVAALGWVVLRPRLAGRSEYARTLAFRTWSADRSAAHSEEAPAAPMATPALPAAKSGGSDQNQLGELRRYQISGQVAAVPPPTSSANPPRTTIVLPTTGEPTESQVPALASADSYDRFTYYQALNQLGGDSGAERNRNGWELNFAGAPADLASAAAKASGNTLNEGEKLRAIEDLSTSDLFSPRPPQYVQSHGDHVAGTVGQRGGSSGGSGGGGRDVALFQTTNYVATSEFATRSVGFGGRGGDRKPARVQVETFDSPEQLGTLERLDRPQTETNQFVGRYAYIVTSPGQTLDLNYVGANVTTGVPAEQPPAANSSDLSTRFSLEGGDGVGNGRANKTVRSSGAVAEARLSTPAVGEGFFYQHAGGTSNWNNNITIAGGAAGGGGGGFGGGGSSAGGRGGSGGGTSDTTPALMPPEVMAKFLELDKNSQSKAIDPTTGLPALTYSAGNVVRTETKVPVLGDTPMTGHLFRGEGQVVTSAKPTEPSATGQINGANTFAVSDQWRSFDGTINAPQIVASSNAVIDVENLSFALQSTQRLHAWSAVQSGTVTVASFTNAGTLELNDGNRFYTGLTRDDVSGLNYLYDANLAGQKQTAAIVPINNANANDVLSALQATVGASSRNTTSPGWEFGLVSNSPVYSADVRGFYDVTGAQAGKAEIPVKYAKSSEIAPALNELGGANAATHSAGAATEPVPAGSYKIFLPSNSPNVRVASGTVSVDGSGNLVVMEDEATIGQIRQTVAAMDKQRAPVKTVGQLEFAQRSENVTTNELMLAENSRPYYTEKQKLQDLLDNKRILEQKIASEKTDLSLPRNSMVEIIDHAVPESADKSTLGEKLHGLFSNEVERSARVRIEHNASDVAALDTRTYVPQSYDPYFIQTEFETIQSEAVLGKVVQDLKLDEAWAGKNGGRKLKTAEAVQLLKKKLDLKPVRNTSVVNIGVKDAKPEEAAKLANAIADAYRAHRLVQSYAMMSNGIAALRTEWAQTEKKVAQAQAELDLAQKESADPQTDVAPPKPATPLPIPQPEVQTADNAFSTFSLNVSDVSFKLAGASLEKGALPDPAGIRSEEFINAFDYRDPEAAPGAAMAFASERARYPFAYNRDLLRFSIKTAAAGRQAGRPLNLVLLLDNSGSMERADRVEIIHQALRVLASQLQPQDTISVVTFARTARLWVDGLPGNQAGDVAEGLSQLTPQGGTNLEDAMNLAYATALRHYLANGINRVVLLTDGAANLGDVDPDTLKQKVEANRKQGIALDCFGIGWEGYNDDLLEVLSRNGDGRYGFINSPEEASTEFAAQLAGALQVAASDVKVQVEFNPKRVTSYRQIGYAKHQLTKEQFRDNTVDAAEIAAQEAGNALYTVEVNPAGEGPLGTVHVRYKIPGTSDYREQEWAVPFNGNAAALEQSSPAMRLAATASAFSEWLATSPYAAEVTTDRLLNYLSGVPEIYGADARPKKLEWMIRQAKAISGK